MVEYTYYCEVNIDREIKKGVYSFTAARGTHRYFDYNRLITLSHTVWRQGPKGGVKFVKSRNFASPSGYITTNEKLMKKFMWVKLQAQSYTKGA